MLIIWLIDSMLIFDSRELVDFSSEVWTLLDLISLFCVAALASSG